MSLRSVFLSCLVPQVEITPDFTQEVLPILEASCVSCHGAEKQKAGLRLDSYAAVESGSFFGEVKVLVPSDAEASILFARVTSSDEDERMPAGGPALRAEEIEVLRRWIDGGARGPEGSGTVAKHWAYVAPVRPEVPPGDADAHPIDRFVAARLGVDGFELSKPASRGVLLRRASLDLVGLPPTLEELDQFLGADDEDAWEGAIDRLLASPHYGEARARTWLDLARYADSMGYEKDGQRTMWRYRDWVIDAFNRDLPFDQFTIEQIAGDLLPDATLEQQVATGFHRNTMTNLEGGVDPEEFRAAAIVDRVNTTAEVWLGTTLACVQCHNHKFDPFTQREYYEFYAFFNQTEDTGSSEEPRIEAPTLEQRANRKMLDAEALEIEKRMARGTPELSLELREFEQAYRQVRASREVVTVSSVSSRDGSEFELQSDGSVLVTGMLPGKDRYSIVIEPRAGILRSLFLEVLTHESLPVGPGRSQHGNSC